MKTDTEIVEDYIDYYKERNFVNNLSIPEQVLISVKYEILYHLYSTNYM